MVYYSECLLKLKRTGNMFLCPVLIYWHWFGLVLVVTWWISPPLCEWTVVVVDHHTANSAAFISPVSHFLWVHEAGEFAGCYIDILHSVNVIVFSIGILTVIFSDMILCDVQQRLVMFKKTKKQKKTCRVHIDLAFSILSPFWRPWKCLI